MDPLSTGVVAGWAALQIGAIASAWLTRLAEGSRMEIAAQACFFGAMAAVGFGGAVSHQLELGLALPSGVTLILMVITAVIDLRRTYEPVPAVNSTRHR